MKNIKNKGLALVISGIGITVAGAFMTSKANIKAKDIMKEHLENKAIIEECAEKYSEEKYSEEDKLKDIKLNNTQTVVKLVKAFAPPIGMTIVGGITTIKGIKELTKYKNGGVQIE